MGKTGIKEILAKAKSEKQGSKLQPKPKAKSAKATSGPSTPATVAKHEKAAALQKFTSLLCISMANRLRAIESMVMWVYLFSSEADIMDCMTEIGKQHHKSIVQAKNGGDAYEPEVPIHCIAWIAVLELLREALTGSPLEDYLDNIADNDYAAVKMDVLYFRKLRCFDKKQSKLLVNLKSGSVAETLWIGTIMPYLKLTYKIEQKYGIAPRSGHERKVLQGLKDMGYIRAHESSVTFEAGEMAVDDDKDL